MKKIELASTIGLFANLGVIVGIIFLIVEIQQSNRIATAEAEIEIRGLFSEINEAFYADSGMAALLVKAQERGAQLTPEEEMRLYGLVQRLTHAWLALEVAHANNVLPDDTFTVIEDNVRRLISRFPLTEPILRQIVEAFPSQQSRATYRIILEVLESAARGV